MQHGNYCIISPTRDFCTKQGRLDEATNYFKKSLEMCRKIPGQDADSSSIVAHLNIIGRLLTETGELNEAEKLSVESIEMAETTRAGN